MRLQNWVRDRCGGDDVPPVLRLERWRKVERRRLRLHKRGAAKLHVYREACKVLLNDGVRVEWHREPHESHGTSGDMVLSLHPGGRALLTLESSWAGLEDQTAWSLVGEGSWRLRPDADDEDGTAAEVRVDGVWHMARFEYSGYCMADDRRDYRGEAFTFVAKVPVAIGGSVRWRNVLLHGANGELLCRFNDDFEVQRTETSV